MNACVWTLKLWVRWPLDPTEIIEMKIKDTFLNLLKNTKTVVDWKIKHKKEKFYSTDSPSNFVGVAFFPSYTCD